MSLYTCLQFEWNILLEKGAVRAPTKFRLPVHSAPLIAKLGIRDIFQINYSLHIL